MNQVTYQVNSILKHLCSIYYLFYIRRDEVNENYLWKGGLYFTHEGPYLLLNNFINCLNGNRINSV